MDHLEYTAQILEKIEREKITTGHFGREPNIHSERGSWNAGLRKAQDIIIKEYEYQR